LAGSDAGLVRTFRLSK